jgi:hypothetical protein
MYFVRDLKKYIFTKNRKWPAWYVLSNLLCKNMTPNITSNIAFVLLWLRCGLPPTPVVITSHHNVVMPHGITSWRHTSLIVLNMTSYNGFSAKFIKNVLKHWIKWICRHNIAINGWFSRPMWIFDGQILEWLLLKYIKAPLIVYQLRKYFFTPPSPEQILLSTLDTAYQITLGSPVPGPIFSMCCRSSWDCDVTSTVDKCSLWTTFC